MYDPNEQTISMERAQRLALELHCNQGLSWQQCRHVLVVAGLSEHQAVTLTDSLSHEETEPEKQRKIQTTLSRRDDDPAAIDNPKADRSSIIFWIMCVATGLAFAIAILFVVHNRYEPNPREQEIFFSTFLDIIPLIGITLMIIGIAARYRLRSLKAEDLKKHNS